MARKSNAPEPTTPYYLARKEYGLSREKLSNLAKLAGVRVSPTSIKKLEDEGEKAIGSRGLNEQVVGYLSYVLGIGQFEATDWSAVEKGAPVLVSGEKGSFSYISSADGNVTVFGDKFKTVPADSVRLVAPTATPSESSAALFETRTRGDGGFYARQVMSYVEQHSTQPHGVGAIAVALGLENGLVSRTVAALVKAGKLTKAGRGVVTLGNTSEAPAEAPAEAPVNEDGTDALPNF